jgi:hypothetical protein
MVVAAGCSETQPSITNVPAARDNVVSAGSIQDQTQFLTSAIAQALSAPSVRTHMRRAMRDSRWTDHKLVLQDYLDGPQGRGLLRVTASVMGMSPMALKAYVDRLPALDFYLPFKANRVAWRGAPDYLVASAFDKFAPTIKAFAEDGSAQTLQLADGAPSHPLIILHPAEVKGLIPASEPRSTGEAIENPAEKGTVRLTELYVAGMPTVVAADVCPTVFALDDPCQGGGGGGGGGSGDITPPVPGVYLIAWDAARGDGWFGSDELEFRSYGFEGVPQYLGNSIWAFDHTCSKGTLAFSTDTHHHDGASLLVSAGIANVSTVSCGFGGAIHGYMLQVLEMDGGLNGSNDDFGRRFFYGGTIPFGGLVTQSGAAWTTGWQDYFSGGGNPSYPDAEYSISLTLQYH